MKEIIMQVDALLSMLEVKGDSVIILADARKALGEVYRIAEEKAAAPDAVEESAEGEK